MNRRVLGFLAVGVWLSSTGVLLADDTVMVLEFGGAKKQAVRDRVIEALEAEKIDVEALEKELRGRKPDEKRLSKVGKRRKVGVFLAGDVVLKKSGWTLTLVARDGETGAQAGELPLKAAWFPKLLDAIDAEVPKFAREHLGESGSGAAPVALPADDEGKGPKKKATQKDAKKKATQKDETDRDEDKSAGKAEDEGAEEKDEEQDEARGKKADDEPKDESEARSGAGELPSPFTLGVALRAVHRDFSYNQDVNGRLRPYELPLAPAVAAGLAWYPAAHFTGGAAAHVGLVLDVERTFFASSDLEEGGEGFETVLFAWAAGLRGRLPVGAHELGISARFGRQVFEVEGDAERGALSLNATPLVRDLIPNVAYTFLRPALDARFAFGPVAVGLAVGYRLVLDAGDIQNAAWFPSATAAGADVSLFGSYELSPTFHAVLGVDARRYGFDMHMKSADVQVAGRDAAGGAIDQYLGASLGIEWRPGGR